MATDETVDAALAEALSMLVPALGKVRLERKDICHFRLWKGDLVIDLHCAARLHEIQPSIAITTPSGLERFPTDVVQEWLREPVRAYLFNNENVRAVSGRVADFAERIIDKYQNDPAAALNDLLAIIFTRGDQFHVDETRRKASEAWAKGDMSLAKSLYEKIVGHLTPVECKRLRIAEKLGTITTTH
jgi:hypothetical protein